MKLRRRSAADKPESEAAWNETRGVMEVWPEVTQHRPCGHLLFKLRSGTGKNKSSTWDYLSKEVFFLYKQTRENVPIIPEIKKNNNQILLTFAYKCAHIYCYTMPHCLHPPHAPGPPFSITHNNVIWGEKTSAGWLKGIGLLVPRAYSSTGAEGSSWKRNYTGWFIHH